MAWPTNISQINTPSMHTHSLPQSILSGMGSQPKLPILARDTLTIKLSRSHYLDLPTIHMFFFSRRKNVYICYLYVNQNIQNMTIHHQKAIGLIIGHHP